MPPATAPGPLLARASSNKDLTVFPPDLTGLSLSVLTTRGVGERVLTEHRHCALYPGENLPEAGVSGNVVEKWVLSPGRKRRKNGMVKEGGHHFP